MSLRVYNTLSQEKEVLTPVHAGKIGIYLCGPTVYKESHIGHAVGPVIFDAIKRYLTFKGYEVTWVVNITDVEDKIMDEARRLGCNVLDLAQRVSRAYCEAMAQLGVQRIDHMPKASEHIPEIISMIRTLMDRGFAYQSGSDVYFDVARDAEYGKLSNRRMEEQAGQRELTAEDKRNPHDFALWKGAKPGEPQEFVYASPWGPGRPGWHIECSAMSMKYLGETLDFHGGGMDLIFPHHENEVAQSECCTGKPFARYWMHHGLTRLNTKKVSKSDPEMAAALDKLTLSNLLGRFSGESLRFFILSTHYRRPIDFSDAELTAKQKGLDSFYRLFERISRSIHESPYDAGPDLHRPRFEDYETRYHAFINEMLDLRPQFLDAMDDDFNTAGAIGVLFQAASAVNRFMDQQQVDSTTAEQPRKLALCAARSIISDGRILGLFERPVQKQEPADDGLTPRLLDLLIELRLDARKHKRYDLADRIRDELTAMGVALEDHSGGTRWRLGGS
jgi:cysteinyl-tRNA synthetase